MAVERADAAIEASSGLWLHPYTIRMNCGPPPDSLCPDVSVRIKSEYVLDYGPGGVEAFSNVGRPCHRRGKFR